MSGVTLAVAPRSEPDESAKSAANQPPQIGAAGIMGSLRVIELQLVAFIMVFSASGLVPLLDLLFPAFTSAYIIALSRFAFPSPARGAPASISPEIFSGGRAFRVYVAVGTAVGLFLPLAYVLGGFARGDDHAVKSATPHLFLLSCQILTDNVISGLSLFSPPVRALVPVLYTVRRIFVVLDWLADVWINKTLPANAHVKDVAWFWFGRILAVVNMGYFSLNLFCFLIPRFLPKAFHKYFREMDCERLSKIAQDKSPSPSSKNASNSGASRVRDKKSD